MFMKQGHLYMCTAGFVDLLKKKTGPKNEYKQY